MTETAIERIKSLEGKELGVSDWIDMTQDKFDGFAEITGDADWLHNDPERCARESPFDRKTIAQGHLLLSHLSSIGESLMPASADEMNFALNYGYDRVRFIRPTTVGSRIRGRLVLDRVRSKGDGRYLIESEVSLEVEGSDSPHLAARWLFLVQI
ncbi:MAG: MaoC family dehydratase [Myxococcota bacterium]|jgi:acyl dehydratase|nr:MaoC family dehydratase [Myxococcota bacterium]